MPNQPQATSWAAATAAARDPAAGPGPEYVEHAREGVEVPVVLLHLPGDAVPVDEGYAEQDALPGYLRLDPLQAGPEDAPPVLLHRHVTVAVQAVSELGAEVQVPPQIALDVLPRQVPRQMLPQKVVEAPDQRRRRRRHLRRQRPVVPRHPPLAELLVQPERLVHDVLHLGRRPHCTVVHLHERLDELH